MYWLTGILGLLFMVAPFIMGFANNSAALWTSLICGLIVLLVSVYKAVVKDKARWEYEVAAIVGLIAVFAPFIFGFSAITMAMWSMIVLGAILAIFGGYLGFFAKPQT